MCEEGKNHAFDLMIGIPKGMLINTNLEAGCLISFFFYDFNFEAQFSFDFLSERHAVV